jgi:hypothetical protein
MSTDPTKRLSRRVALRSLVGGSLLMPGLVSDLLAAEGPGDPLAPRPPHFAPRAKRVIFLYMSGGVSQVDTFDPKPRLLADAVAGTRSPENGRPYLRPFWEFKRGGKSGLEISDLFPHLRERADDLCVIRSMHGDHNDHVQATLGIHTGSVSVVRPSLGAWVSYGLGTLSRNLPSFVVLAPRLPYCGPQAYGNDFLPADHQGTRVLPGDEPVPNLKRRAPSEAMQRLELAALGRMNARHAALRGGDGLLAARMRTYETAFQMQMEMPEVLDLSKESDVTLALYGLPRGSTKGFAWQCLVARRLVERGVRFVELIDSGSTNNWDAHSNIGSHAGLARNVDQAMAGLLADLAARGLLEDTLVVWSSEFGRSPFIDGPDGRSHQQQAFSAWLAGAGVRGGLVHGSTDEYARRVVDKAVHVHDLHATILHLLGLDHERLTFRHAGRDFRLTDVHGRVVREILT